jgi:hypothetical protein
MLWTLDFDDYSGQFCNDGPFPLANAIKLIFEEYSYVENLNSTKSNDSLMIEFDKQYISPTIEITTLNTTITTVTIPTIFQINTTLTTTAKNKSFKQLISIINNNLTNISLNTFTLKNSANNLIIKLYSYFLILYLII